MDDDNPYYAANVFGIKNNPNENFDFPMINKNVYSNMIKPNILWLLPHIRQDWPVSEPFTPQTASNWHMPNRSTPLLLEHFDDLSYLWKDFKERSIITNRGTLRSLTNPSKKFGVQLSVKKLNNEKEEKLYYILNNLPQTYSPTNIDHVTPLLVQSPSVEYTDYICKELEINEFSTKVYYTSEIDAFDSVNKVPIEIKGFKNIKNCYELYPQIAYSAAVQCHLAGVNDILVAFYSENNMVLKMFTLDDLKKRVAIGRFDFDKAIAKINFILNEIFDYADTFRGYLCNKTVNISQDKVNEQLIFQINK